MYLKWDEKTISDFSDENINQLYNQGYFFSRAGKGIVYQTRSIRIDLSKFKLTSENRRILKKNESVFLKSEAIPYSQYNWEIGKMGKEFYTTKFGDGTFSANKIKELVTNPEKSNFNTLYTYTIEGNQVGYTICLENKNFLHYCYPFYLIRNSSIKEYSLPSTIGLGMMTKAIVRAQEDGKKYVYLGSAQRPSDTYKLQFEGLEWFDGVGWKRDVGELKAILKNI